jgi:hypothetical protein
VVYFTDSSGTNNDTSGDFVFSNPFFFGGNATVFDIEYTAVNGFVTNFDPSPSNGPVATLMVEPLANTAPGGIKLEDSANLAGLSTTDDQFTDTFSSTFSKVLLSLVAGVMVPSPATELLQDAQIIVARVPKAPLYTLVVLSFMFVGFRIFLNFVTLAAAQNAMVEEVKQKLSLQHVVAEKFEGERAHEAVESLDECFEEFRGAVPKRVGVVETGGGGWELKDLGDRKEVKSQGYSAQDHE